MILQVQSCRVKKKDRGRIPAAMDRYFFRKDMQSVH